MAILDIFKKKKDPKKETPKAVGEPKKATKENATVENMVEPKKVAEEKKPVVTEAKIEKKAAPAPKKTEKKAPAKEVATKDEAPKNAPAKKADPKVENKPKSETATKVENKTKTQITPKAEAKVEAKAVAKKPETKKPTTEVKAEVVENKAEENVAAESKAFTGRFEINKSKDGKKYFFNLFASNQVGIASSQMYSTSQSALNGVKSVIANAPKAPIEDQTLKTYEELPYPKWEIYLDNGGKYRFRLNASNGNCVCHSQGYTTKTACKNGIDSIIRSSKNAEIDKTYIKKDED